MAKNRRGGRKATPQAQSQPKKAKTGSITLGNGEKIEYEGNLTYGNDDATLSPAVRKTIESWEKRRASAKIEYGYAVDSNGNAVGKEVRGGKQSVQTPLYYHATGNTFTHIHPRGGGQLGGTFSPTDLSAFGTTGEQTMRAVAKEGTYSISKGQNFHGYSLYKYLQAESRKASAKARQAMTPINKTIRDAGNDYSSGKISRAQYDAAYKQYQKDAAKIFNTQLVELHDALLNGQKQFNYTYTLERRK